MKRYRTEEYEKLIKIRFAIPFNALLVSLETVTDLISLFRTNANEIL